MNYQNIPPSLLLVLAVHNRKTIIIVGCHEPMSRYCSLWCYSVIYHVFLLPNPSPRLPCNNHTGHIYNTIENLRHYRNWWHTDQKAYERGYLVAWPYHSIHVHVQLDSRCVYDEWLDEEKTYSRVSVWKLKVVTKVLLKLLLPSPTNTLFLKTLCKIWYVSTKSMIPTTIK